MPFTPTPKWQDIEGLRTNRKFRTAADKAIEIKRQIEALEDQLDELKMQKLLPDMIAADCKRVIFSVKGPQNTDVDYQIGVVERKETKRLNKQKLIVEMEKRGIDTSIIDDCSDTSPASTYVEIRSPREQQEPFTKAVRSAVNRSKVA